MEIIPAIPLARFEKGLSRLPFAHSWVDKLFLVCCQMATDLQSQSSRYCITLYATILPIILRSLGTFL